MADWRGVPTPHGARPAVLWSPLESAGPSAASTNPEVQESALSTLGAESESVVVVLQARVLALEQEVDRLSPMRQTRRRSTPYGTSQLSDPHPRNLGA